MALQKEKKPAKGSALFLEDRPNRPGKKPKGKQQKQEIQSEADLLGRKAIVDEKEDATENSIYEGFNQPWHNNNPFVLVDNSVIRNKSAQCPTCKCEFPQPTGGKWALRPMPHDICVEHKERYQFYDRSQKEIKVSKKQTRNVYYHLSPQCLAKRHPYFNPRLFEVSSTLNLRKPHRDLLKRRFNWPQ